MQTFIKTLPTKDPFKFPTLPTQSPPDEGWYWEELSDLFVNTVKGGKNYREVLYQRRIFKIDISKEKIPQSGDMSHLIHLNPWGGGGCDILF